MKNSKYPLAHKVVIPKPYKDALSTDIRKTFQEVEKRIKVDHRRNVVPLK